MKDIKIIESFLSEIDYGEIKSLLCNYQFPWHFSPVIQEEDSNEIWQFEHTFYQDNVPSSVYFNVIKTHLINHIPNLKSLLRVKANINPNTGKQKMKNMFHTDFPLDENDFIKTAVFYLDTNNGYTLFENGQKVDSVKNRLAIFNKNTLHTGVETTDQRERIVININYI